MKHILLLTTGGTIASAPGTDGLTPGLSDRELLSSLGDLDGHYDIETKPIMNLDSSNIQAAHWQVMSRSIYENYADYDGFILTHGTDTMAYSASMLSFMLKNLQKPVVFTGSQIPIGNLLTDARNNLFCALAAVDAEIPGVSIAFNRHIIRGCRAVKVRTMGFDAFESVNARYLGEIFADGLRVYSEPSPPSGKPMELLDQICTDVILLKLIPNMNPALLDCLPAIGCRGLVLETFGAGGINSRQLADKLLQLADKGIVVAACSQCLYESSNFTIYEVGRKLLASGAIPAGDMTSEAAVTKLMWILGQTEDPNTIRQMFLTNYAGEITE